VPLIFAPF